MLIYNATEGEETIDLLAARGNPGNYQQVHSGDVWLFSLLPPDYLLDGGVRDIRVRF